MLWESGLKMYNKSVFLNNIMAVSGSIQLAVPLLCSDVELIDW